MLIIKNSAQEIIGTNFWEPEHAHRGVFYLSLHAGVFRLLVPEAHTSAVAEFRRAHEVFVSRGPWTAAGGRSRGRAALEILFDDRSNNPFALHLDARQVDRMPASTDVSREWALTAWVWQGKPVCAYRQTCFYRIVPSLPWLKGRREL